uniref:Uncharacterized protein n=2 Tax=unclassified Mycobacterium TaxID=2642494 RepID=A0A5Q5BRK5_MYCSS
MTLLAREVECARGSRERACDTPGEPELGPVADAPGGGARVDRTTIRTRIRNRHRRADPAPDVGGRPFTTVGADPISSSPA